MSPVTEKFLELSVTGDRATPVIGDILAGTRRSYGRPSMRRNRLRSGCGTGRPSEDEAAVSTMRDVAKLAGVSAKTVSRVMNNDRYVSDDVRTRVLQAVDQLQYVPNVMARSFRSGQDAAIGVAVPAVTGFFGYVVEAVERIARDRGVAMYLTCLGDDPDGEQAAVEALLARNVVGLLLAPVADDQSYLKPWRERTSMVFLDRRPRKLSAAYVVHD